MPNTRYKPLADGEPKGEAHGEPRKDNLNLVIEDGGEKYWENEDGRRVCGAKCSAFSENWKRCRSRKLKVNNRCYRHGGESPTGADNPSFKDGRHSKYLPKGLIERYNEFLNDPDLTSLREEIALLDTRLSMVIASMDDDYGVGLWEDLREAYRTTRDALRSGDHEAAAQGLNELERIITQGSEQVEVWEEIQDIVEQRRKVAKTETQRVQKESQSLSVEQALVMARYLAETATDLFKRYNVPDEARDELADAIERVYLN